MEDGEVESYLLSKGFQYKDKGDKFTMPCPIPGCKEKKNEHFAIWKDSGAWTCIYGGHPGDAKGNFKRLRYLLGDYVRVSPISEYMHKTYTVVEQDLCEKSALNWAFHQDTLSILESKRGITRETVSEFKIGITSDASALVYPYFENGELVKVKHIKRNEDGSKDCWFVKDAKIPLWNVDSIKGHSICAITEGEMDCMSLRQLGWEHGCVSVPKGAKDWQPEYTKALSECNEIWLYYDSDAAGRSGTERAISSLGEGRCKVAHLPFKDINECLQQGLVLSDLMNPDIITIPGTSPIGRPRKYLDELIERIGDSEYTHGIGTPFLDLDQSCRIRYGTLLSILGKTGSGKSTFATYLAYSWMARDIPVCIASFEMQKIDIVQQVLQSEVGKPYEKMTKEDIMEVYDDVAGCPLFILEIFGRAKLDELSKSIRAVRHQYGVKIFVVDSLQFIANTSSSESVSIAMETLNDLCNELKVTVVLINHPNRGMAWKSKDAELSMTDSKGGSAIEDISHAVWILDRDTETDRVFLRIDKNRIDGVIGKTFMLELDKESKTYTSHGAYTKPKIKKNTKNTELREAIQKDGMLMMHFNQGKDG